MRLRVSSEFISVRLGVGGRGPRPGDIGDQRLEADRQRLAARHQHVIMAGSRVQRRDAAHGFAQPPLDAVAHRGIAGLLGDGEAESRVAGGGLGVAGLGLQRESGGVDALALGRALVFATLRQPAPSDRIVGQGSGRELLAASRAAGVEDLAAADRRHARAKPVTALAHEFARLIGALHGRKLLLRGAFKKIAAENPAALARLIGEAVSESQRHLASASIASTRTCRSRCSASASSVASTSAS